jgi:segregation and condensation protein B
VSIAADTLVQERFRTTDAVFNDTELDAAVEALLIVATEPPTTAQLAEALEIEERGVRAAIDRLAADTRRGWILQRHGDTVQLTSAPRFAEHVRRFLGLEREARLSSAALETLAIVAYRQPVARSEIEYVRGVDCSGVLSTLLNRGLIENGNTEGGPGRPYLYNTTPAFLMHFGLHALSDLPDLGKVNSEDASEQLTALIAEAADAELAAETA